MFTKFIYRNLINATCLVITLGLFACNNRNVNTRYIQYNQPVKIKPNLPQVVATTSVLCDLTQQIAGNTINLKCLISPGTNPNNYQPTSEDIQYIQSAKLILYHGYNFESKLIKSIQNTQTNAPKIAVGEIAVPNPEKIRKNGKIITEPHIWHDVKNTINMVEVINSNLNKITANNKEEYNINTAKLTQELNELDNWIKVKLATIPDKNRKLLTTHPAMIYYVKAYNFPYQRSLETVRNKNRLTQTTIKNLANNIKTSKAPTIFSDKTVNPILLEPVINIANVKLFERQLYIDSLGQPGSDRDTYQKMMDANTRSIVEGLGGTYLRFTPNVGR
jgi:manganese/iron transport system substrate-binding protein